MQEGGRRGFLVAGLVWGNEGGVEWGLHGSSRLGWCLRKSNPARVEEKKKFQGKGIYTAQDKK